LDAQDETGCLALGLAAQQGDADMVRHLLVRGANVNAPDFYGQTALHFAAEFGHTEVADVLIMAGKWESIIFSFPSIIKKISAYGK
jgi:ankyrin repeat protein